MTKINKQLFQTLKVHIGDHLAVCTFNRPEVRNALNQEMVAEIRQLLVRLREEGEFRVVIFTGSGEKAFISGADIKELKERNNQDALCQINSRLFQEIEEFPFPTIAAIRGYALGGGCELAMACDLRICGEGAHLGQPEVSLGILPAAGGCYRLSQLVGIARAKELVYTGKIISAQEGVEMGLVNHTVPDHEVLEAAKKLAKDISKNGKLAVQLAKATLNTTMQIPTTFGMGMETAAQGILFEDEEKHKRMQDFLDRKKRKKS
jgi:enoyl-CoA hydratase